MHLKVLNDARVGLEVDWTEEGLEEIAGEGNGTPMAP